MNKILAKSTKSNNLSKNKTLLFIIGDFKYGGIGRYSQKVIPAISRKFRVSTLTRDIISNKEIKKYKIKKCFFIKIPKIFNFWPLKELYFFIQGLNFFKNKSFDIIILNYPFYIPKINNSNTKIINIFHSLHKQFVTADCPNSFKFFFIKLLHLSMIPLDFFRLKRANKNIFISKTLVSLTDIKNKIFIPNPLEKSIKIRNKTYKKQIKILFIARNDPFKGIDFLERILSEIYIKNYKKYNKIKFSIVGIKKLNKTYPNTQIYGKLSFFETNKLLKKTDILLSTSFSENTPNILFEALENNVIPLFSDVGDCKYIIKNSSIIFKSNNLEDFMNKFDRLLININNKNIPKINIKKINENYSLKKTNNTLVREISNLK
jgi:glycosyltransferase involved in cell wall biosynthesis